MVSQQRHAGNEVREMMVKKASPGVYPTVFRTDAEGIPNLYIRDESKKKSKNLPFFSKVAET